jgi:hypothetical protein
MKARSFPSRNDRRVVLERESERPEQEEHEWQMNEQLEERKANDVARA